MKVLILLFTIVLSCVVYANSKTEAESICNKPECYGLPSDATVDQIIKLCHKALPAYCQDVDIKYTQCYPSKDAISFVAEIGLGCGKGSWEGIKSTAQSIWGMVKYPFRFVTSAEVRKEALDTTSYLLHSLSNIDVEKVGKLFGTSAQQEWNKFLGCLNHRGKSEYSCKAMVFAMDLILGGKGLHSVGKNFLKLFKTSANLQDVAIKVKGKLIVAGLKNRRLAIIDLSSDEIQSLRYIGSSLKHLDITGLNNNMINKMTDKISMLHFRRIIANNLKDIDLRKASSVLDLINLDSFVTIVKANIKKGIPLPKLPTRSVNHTLDQFTPNEIPKLNGLGKNPYILIKLSPAQAKQLTIQQAKDIKEYLNHPHNQSLFVSSEWKEQIKVIDAILKTGRNPSL